MILLAKIIDETKNKYEKGGRIKEIRLMIKHLKDKTNVITAVCSIKDSHYIQIIIHVSLTTNIIIQNNSNYVLKFKSSVKTYCSLQVDLSNNCFELHAEGDLMIAGTKKKLHVIILNNMLLILKEQKSGLLEYKAHILVSFL